MLASTAIVAYIPATMQTRVHVFTFRDGLLARTAHDLRLTLGRFELRLERGKLVGWFDPTSLRVDGVAHGDEVDARALSNADKQKIYENLTRDVLDTARYPQIELQAEVRQEGGRFAIEGQLRLHGRERPISAVAKFDVKGPVAEVELSPSRFGIPPFKALGGAIRLQDRVRVRVQVLADRDSLETLNATGQRVSFVPH